MTLRLAKRARKIGRAIGKNIGIIIGWTIVGVLGLGGIVAVIIFAGYVILWVLIIAVGLALLFGLFWLLFKLLD
jgi:hypothetical protein